jgi:hypothetical protein
MSVLYMDLDPWRLACARQAMKDSKAYSPTSWPLGVYDAEHHMGQSVLHYNVVIAVNRRSWQQFGDKNDWKFVADAIGGKQAIIVDLDVSP